VPVLPRAPLRLRRGPPAVRRVRQGRLRQPGRGEAVPVRLARGTPPRPEPSGDLRDHPPALHAQERVHQEARADAQQRVVDLVVRQLRAVAGPDHPAHHREREEAQVHAREGPMI